MLLPRLVVLLALLFATLIAPPVLAQTTDWVTSPVKQTSEAADDAIGLRNGNFIAVPVPFSSPAVGSGLALGGGYLFKLSPEARTSFVGIGALVSEKGSEAYLAAASVALNDNRWLLDFAFGKADLRYDLISGVATIPLRQTGDLANIGLAYGVTPDVSFGGNIRYLDTDVGLDFGLPGSLPDDLLPVANLELINFTLNADWDLRDDTDYPSQGTRLYGEVMQAVVLNADERQYERAIVRLDGYYPLAEQTVLAGRAVTCGSSNDTPFFDKCSIGITDNFRGFNGTRFLDDRMVSFQAEVRQRFTKRIGGVAFAGIGWSGESYDALRDSDSNVAGGLGLRFRVSQNFPVDLAVDMSRNDIGEELLYISVGQRF